MNAPTVAEKIGKPDSLWEFLGALPGSFEAQIFYALIIFGITGMAANYFQRWLRDEIEGNLFGYLFFQHPKRTLLSFSTYLGLAVTALTTGVFMNDGHFAGWYNVLCVSFTTAFGVDVLTNKGATKVWTAEERAAKVQA